MNRLDNIIDLLGGLKDVKRTGWLHQKVESSESVADHSWSVAFLVLLLAPKHLNMEKCLKLAVLHDLQEVIVGDITPFDGISKEEKLRLEKGAVAELAKKLEYPELKELFAEYLENKTAEVRFVKDIDRIEAVLQAKFYDNKKRCSALLLPEFYAYASTHLNNDETLIDEIMRKISQD